MYDPIKAQEFYWEVYCHECSWCDFPSFALEDSVMAGKQKRSLRQVVIDAQESMSEVDQHLAVWLDHIEKYFKTAERYGDAVADLTRLAKWMQIHKSAALADLQELAERIPDDSVETEQADTVVIEPVDAGDDDVDHGDPVA